MPIKKQYLKSKPTCKVTFRVSKNQADGLDQLVLAGDFTNWEAGAIPMKKLKSGDFTQTVELEPGTQYQFRYLSKDNQWINDAEADAYVASGVGPEENGVIIL